MARSQAGLPRQPREKDWLFVKELRTTPYHHKVVWEKRTAKRNEVCFQSGVQLKPLFDDPPRPA